MSKICSKCGSEKEIYEFYITSGNRCKPCHNSACMISAKRNPKRIREAAKKWYYAKPENSQKSIDKARIWQKANKKRDALRKFGYNLIRNYGLSYEDYCLMVEKQDGKCAICKQPPTRNLDVDHNHVTGAIRQLLCSNCNTAIGLLKENRNLFQKAVEYLDKHTIQSSS